MKDQGLERRLVQEFPLDREVGVSIDDVGRQLHDAWLEVDSLVRDSGQVVVPGYWESPISRGLFRKRGRFPVRLRATGVEVLEFEDDEELGGIMVCEARPASTSKGLHIEGCIPARLRLLGADLQLFVTISSAPHQLKRPFGPWLPAM